MVSVRAAFLAAMVYGLATPVYAEGRMTPEQREAFLKTLHWTDGADSEIPDAAARLNVPHGYHLLVGEDARKAMEVDSGIPHPLTDAVMVDPVKGDVIIFDHVLEGYVKSDDWNKVDADEMLQNIIKNTDAANAEKEEQGLPPVHVIGWTQKPAFDPDTHTVQWALDVMSDNGKFTNTVQLMLGRRGYEKLTWVGKAAHSSTAFLAEARKDFVFKSGETYNDFKDGDKIAAYGLGALVATMLGAKVAAHFGLLAGLLLILKKGLVLIVAGIAVLKNKIKAFFSGKKKDQPMTSNTNDPPPQA